jgi:AcrR family transcriptional regulator
MSTSEIGLRERKRRETNQRISQAALKLFADNGYEATTLDAIAEAAGISRRTFFHYFASKDEILLSLQGGLGEQLLAFLESEPEGNAPLPSMLSVMRRAASGYTTDDLIAIDKVMMASEAIQARKQANYAKDEKLLFAAFSERWPDEDPNMLRLVAMLSINLTRVSLDVWRDEGMKRTVGEVLEDIIGALRAMIPSPRS